MPCQHILAQPWVQPPEALSFILPHRECKRPLIRATCQTGMEMQTAAQQDADSNHDVISYMLLDRCWILTARWHTVQPSGHWLLAPVYTTQ